MVFSDHKVAPWPQKQSDPTKKVKNGPKDLSFCSAGRPDSCHIANPKIFTSALAGVLTAGTLTINHSLFTQ